MRISLSTTGSARKIAATTALVAALGAGLFGGTAVAIAKPGHPCGHDCGNHNGWRGIEQGRFDHQPFNYDGRWVTPVYHSGYGAWGFWLGPVWIPL